MGIKELCEKLGSKYRINDNENGTVRVKIDGHWKYNETCISELSGLFKELYGGYLEDLFKENASMMKLIDKDK